MNSLYQSSIQSLPLLGHGKVRDNYAVGDDKILIVTTDRLSAFDVVMNEPIPGKGKVLNQMCDFWFEKLGHIVPNHLTGIAPESRGGAGRSASRCSGRAVVAKRLKPIMVEAVVRGYIIGSGWKDYQETGSDLRHRAAGRPAAGRKAAASRSSRRRPRPTWASTTKTSRFAEMEAAHRRRTGAPRCATSAITLYTAAAEYAATRGIIIADTKFEFGLDDNGVLHLMDEVLTADSSRFWPADSYAAGHVAAVVRQAVRARLPGNADRLEQDRAGAAAAGTTSSTKPRPSISRRIERLTGEKLKA